MPKNGRDISLGFKKQEEFTGKEIDQALHLFIKEESNWTCFGGV